MRIDFHCHIFQNLKSINALMTQFRDFSGYGFYERIKKGISNIEPRKFKDVIDKTLFYIEKAKLDKVILLPLSLNENQIAIEWQKRAPEIFIPFYNPPEGKKEKRELRNEIENSIIKNDFKGLKITTTFRKRFLGNKILTDAFEVAQEHKLVALLHTGYPPPGTKKKVLSYSNPLNVEEIIQSFPNLKIIIAHMGYPWVDIALSLAVQYQNIFLDISNLTYMMPNRLKDFLQRAKELIGLDKILFGSDGFIPEMIQFSIDLFENIDYLSKEEIKKIIGLNAQKLLDL